MPFDTHATANLPPLAILKNVIFFEKSIYFSKKKTNFDRLEKSYYFSRILGRQICHNFLEKKSRSETWENIVNAIGKHQVKKRTIWVEEFATIFYIYMAQINNYSFQSQENMLECFERCGRHFSVLLVWNKMHSWKISNSTVQRRSILVFKLQAHLPETPKASFIRAFLTGYR